MQPARFRVAQFSWYRAAAMFPTAFFDGLVDHAPLFPPAALPPPEAVADHIAALRSPHRRALARLAWPAATIDQLGQLVDAADVGPDERPTPEQPWHLALLLRDTALPPVDARFRVDQVEIVLPADAGVAWAASLALRATVPVWFEVDGSPPGIEQALRTLTAARDHVGEAGQVGAKIRCGGDSVPTADELAASVVGCRRAQLPFKATAGLHHALAGPEHHGLLCVMLAAAFRLDEAETAKLLCVDDAAALAFDDTGVTWAGHRLSAADAVRSRQTGFHSVGSCSFDEPIDDLRALEVLA